MRDIFRDNIAGDFQPPRNNEDLIAHHMAKEEIMPDLPLETAQMLVLAKTNGYLMGRNSVLENANHSLMQTSDKMLAQIHELTAELAKQTERADNAQSLYYDEQRQKNNLLTERAQMKTQLAAKNKRK